MNAIQPVAPERFEAQFFELVNETLYDDECGLSWDDPTFREPEANVV